MIRRLIRALVPLPTRRRLNCWLGRIPEYDRPLPEALARFVRRHPRLAITSRGFDGRLAVVVPCYNHARFLPHTVESLARQTLQDFEAVFVEDHGTDDTRVCLERLAPTLPSRIRSRILRTPRNSGQAAAINLGVAATQASAIVILNDDDYLMWDALEVIRSLLERYPDLTLLSGSCIPFAGTGRPPGREEEWSIRSRWPDFAALPLRRHTPEEVRAFRKPNALAMTHTGTAFLRAAWECVGGYYPDKTERVVPWSDRDFQLRVASLFPSASAPTVPFCYWRSDSSVDVGRNT